MSFGHAIGSSKFFANARGSPDGQCASAHTCGWVFAVALTRVATTSAPRGAVGTPSVVKVRALMAVHLDARINRGEHGEQAGVLDRQAACLSPVVWSTPTLGRRGRDLRSGRRTVRGADVEARPGPRERLVPGVQRRAERGREPARSGRRAAKRSPSSGSASPTEIRSRLLQGLQDLEIAG